MFSSLYPLPYLPAYTGPYKVGTTEVEVPISDLPKVENTRHDLDTIKFRIFYPTNQDAKSSSAAYWLPEPQKEWTEAYASFMGATSGWKSFMATSALSMLKYVKLPAIKDSPLFGPSPLHGFPVCVFSHGLGGTLNSYSSVAGNLASCGVICFVPEHRDGSAPVTFVRDSQGQCAKSIPYQKHSHDPSPKVLNARNVQLRVRLWELEHLYSSVNLLNDGQSVSNYASTGNSTSEQSWDELKREMKGRLDLRPGRVTFAGHSFGAATVTQFVKSVFYHNDSPMTPLETKQVEQEEEEGWDWTPLARYATGSAIVRQVTPNTPIALLDLWTMPLRGEPTRWLFEKPLPCYSRDAAHNSASAPSTISVMSAEFYKWSDLLNRTRALLSFDPAATNAYHERLKHAGKSTAPSLPQEDDTRTMNPIPELSKQPKDSSKELKRHETIAEMSRSPSPANSLSTSPADSASSSTTSLGHTSDPQTAPVNLLEPHLYLVTHSAHLSQSDFGVLFPNLTKYVMKAIEPEKTLELNLRAILAMMKSQDLPVQSITNVEIDRILEEQPETQMDKEERWVRVPLSEGVEAH